MVTVVDLVDRLTVRTAGPDPRDAALLSDARALGVPGVEAIEVSEIYFVTGDLSPAVRDRIESLVVDPLLQHGVWGTPTPTPGTISLETTLLPGVTDSVAAALLGSTALLELPVHAVATGRRFDVRGAIDEGAIETLAERLLANAVIERVAAAPISAPVIEEIAPPPVQIVSMRGLDDAALLRLDAERGMALDLAELHVIVTHFDGLGRDPTDVELETIAQTWSEHCAHKTFRATISLPDGTAVEPLLKQLRNSTEMIDAPFVRSSFVGNAGILCWVPGTTVAIKAETHNHPSAIEPFGGANTGVGGVIRDVLGAAHHPIALTDVLCFGPSDLSPADLPPGVLHPRLIEEGVIAGVADYGNKIGLPTVAGAVLYDPGYTANPLVFCGCVGVAPDADPLPGPRAGDAIVALGGRTGRDGLRGATFSSATMDATTGEVAGASVQIGDPITEKLLLDLFVDLHGRYTGLTDCGAGGFSSAIGEMAESVGADVDLALAPLKYPGLGPWEIWLSEAQERMVISVDPTTLDDVLLLAAARGVEATVLGHFTGDGVLRVRHGDATVLELDTGFLHDGRPQRSMEAILPTPDRVDCIPSVDDHGAALLALLAHPDIASKEAVIRRYDHEILGATLVRPLVGVHADAPADGVVLAAPGDTHGIAIGIGVNPHHGEIDPWRMAYAAVDEAIRNVVAVGADPDAVALMDNFSWGDPRRRSTLGDLVAAVDACCRAAEANAAPFVSGKDSLNNEYVGADGERHSVPPTLVITAVAHVPDVECVVSSDLQQSDNLLVLLGSTSPEFGGSHLSMVLGEAGGSVPAPDPAAPARYRALHRAIRQGVVRSCHDVSEGGLAVTLAEMAIGGDLGLILDGIALDSEVHNDPTVALFAESSGRLVCEIVPGDLDRFREILGEPITVLGRVTDDGMVDLGVCAPAVGELRAAFTGRTDARGVAG